MSEKVAPVADVARGSLLRLEGVLAIPRVGADYVACAFDLAATGQAAVYMNGVQVVRIDGRGRAQPREVTLAAGLHPMTILFSHSAYCSGTDLSRFNYATHLGDDRRIRTFPARHEGG